MDEDDQTKPHVPEEEPKTVKEVEKTLDGILGWVQEKKAEAEDPKTTTTKSTPWGWVVGLVVAVLIFCALAFLAWRAWSKGREIAKLKHELDVKKEEERKAKINAELEKNKKQRKQLESKAVSITATVGKIKDEIKEAEDERRLAHKTIDEITSWEDVDKIVGEPDAIPDQPSDSDTDPGPSVGEPSKETSGR